MIGKRDRLFAVYSTGQRFAQATLVVPQDVRFEGRMDVRARTRTEILTLSKPDYDWMLTSYPAAGGQFQEEIVNLEELLEWVTLPPHCEAEIKEVVAMAKKEAKAEASQGPPQSSRPQPAKDRNGRMPGLATPSLVQSHRPAVDLSTAP